MKAEKAIFSAGCFWHIQHDFDILKGVVNTTAGYIGGNEKKYPNPTYELLHEFDTGYAEAVEVIYNSEVISYEELLKYFWKMHDPTLQDRQGPDVGNQYRAEIFYINEKQKKLAEKSKKEIEKLIDKKVYTKIERAGLFFKAEEYHQKYLEKTGKKGCGINI